MVCHTGPHNSQAISGVCVWCNLLAGLDAVADGSAVRIPEHFPNHADTVAVFLHLGEDFHPISNFDAFSMNFNPQRRTDTDAHFIITQEHKRSQRAIAPPDPITRYHAAKLTAGDETAEDYFGGSVGSWPARTCKAELRTERPTKSGSMRSKAKCTCTTSMPPFFIV